MKVETTKEISLTTIFAVIYAVAVITLLPISFSIFQVRIADALLPLAILFGWPTIIGVSLGTIVANFFGGLGVIDVIGGTTANFIATLLAWKIGSGKRKFSWIYAIICEILIVTIVVGSYLSYLFNMPIVLGLSGVLIGSIIAIGVLGYLLLTALSRSYIVKSLKKFGIRIYSKK
jgi:uncharacterized membrane protein